MTPSSRPPETPPPVGLERGDDPMRADGTGALPDAPPADDVEGTPVAYAPARAALFGRLGAAAAMLTIIAAGAGLLDQTLYRPSTPESLLPGTASQDVVSLFAALGVLACLRACRRGARRLRLVVVGLLSYLLYAYALYAFAGVYNPFFLCYVAIAGLSLQAILTFFASADLAAMFPVARRGSFPRRPVAAYLFVLNGLFATLWLAQILPAMASRVPPEGSVVLVLDLAIFLPLYTVVALLLWHRLPLADVLLAPVLVKVGALGLSVLIGTLLVPLYGGELRALDVALYASMGLIPIALLPIVLGALDTRPSTRSPDRRGTSSRAPEHRRRADRD